jgi:hypothetical protein
MPLGNMLMANCHVRWWGVLIFLKVSNAIDECPPLGENRTPRVHRGNEALTQLRHGRLVRRRGFTSIFEVSCHLVPRLPPCVGQHSTVSRHSR